MKRAIIYARTSSQESDKTESIPDQIKRCISYCKRAGYDVINKPETDPDIAGQWYPPQYAELAELERDYLLSAMPSVKKMHYRSGLGNVLNQLSNIDAIVCISRSRFDRSLEHSYLAQKLRRDLSEHNVVLDCLGTIHDYSKSNTTGIDQLLQTQAKAAKREEMISGLNAKNNIREKGFVGAGNKNSYGYEHRGKQTVDILPDEAEIVKRIYHEFTNDKPINAIVQQFNYEKIPRFSPNRKKNQAKEQKSKLTWDIQKVKKILINPRYIGKTYVPRTNELIDSVVYEPILDDKIWHKAQAKLNKNRRKFPTRARNPNPKRKLTGLMVCGNCGLSQIQSNSSKKPKSKEYYKHYVCPAIERRVKSDPQKTECRLCNVAERFLVPTVDNLVIKYAHKSYKKHVEDAIKTKEKTIETEKELETEKKKLKKIMLKFADDDSTTEVFDEIYQEIKDKIKSLQNNLSEYRSANINDVIANKNEAVRADIETYRSVIEKIINYHDKIEIYLKIEKKPITIDRDTNRRGRPLNKISVMKMYQQLFNYTEHELEQMETEIINSLNHI